TGTDPVSLHDALPILSDGVTVSGRLSVPWEGPCRRCLEQTSGVEVVELREVFSDSPVDDDLLSIDGDVIDLGPVVHDAAVLALRSEEHTSELQSRENL